MDKKYERFLPLGTLVKIDEKLKRVMIIGFGVKVKNKEDKIFDYMGCIYPEGLLSNTEFFTFNHSDIKEICVLGYSDQEQQQFNLELNTKINNIKD